MSPGAQEAVSNYYSTAFGPALAKRTGESVDASLFKPTSNAQTHLQAAYTVPAHGDFDTALKVGSAGDPSAWSAADARYQPFFADLTERFGFEDAMILDNDGNVVYTYVDSQLHSIAASLGLRAEAVAAMVGSARQLLYAEGELIQPVNSVPDAVGFITSGSVGMIVYAGDGRELSLGRLGVGDYIGTTALTRQRMLTGMVALADTTIVSVPRDAMNIVVQQDPGLARQIGEAIEMRRKAATDALASAAQGVR